MPKEFELKFIKFMLLERRVAHLLAQQGQYAHKHHLLECILNSGAQFS